MPGSTARPAPGLQHSQMLTSIVPARQEPRPPERKPRSGGAPGFPKRTINGIGGMCDRPVHGTARHYRGFRLHDRRGRTAFSARIRIGNPRWPRFWAQPDQGMAPRELRSKRMGDEKSGVGPAGIRRREAVVPFRGPGSRETYEPSPSQLWGPGVNKPSIKLAVALFVPALTKLTRSVAISGESPNDPTI